MTRTGFSFLLAAMALPPAFSTPASEADSARRKLAAIDNQEVKRGSSILLTRNELNDLAREEAAKEVGNAIRNTRADFRTGGATGSALIDFVKMQTNKGKPPGFLFRWLLAGEREVEVTVSASSANGQATVNVDKVVIQGVPVSGRLLDLLIEYYVLPRYPEAKIGKPFQLQHGVDRVELSAEGMRVHIRS